MDRTVDFELGIYRRNTDMYGINLRFAQPDDEVDVRLSGVGPALDDLDSRNFLEHQENMEAYGQLLAQHIFADQNIRDQYLRARTYADANNLSVRIRLFIDRSAPELHALRWEALRAPQDMPDSAGGYVSVGERVLFSRYISSSDARPVRPRPKSELRVLAVIANPSNLADYELEPIDVAAELEQVREGIGEDTKIEELTAPGMATFDNIMAKLRDEQDILYIVCHGKQHVSRQDGQPRSRPALVLEDENGAIHMVYAGDFVTRLRELKILPKLIVLASCGSAGSGEAVRPEDTSALAMLGPRLADAGVPAVIAMQGLISMETVASFMPVFFRELRRDGLVDRAMAVARGATRDRHDWWVPTLMMRLQRGQIWYTPGFDQDSSSRKRWPDLHKDLRRERYTPILGPSLSRSFMGSRQEMARQWADTYRYPLSPHERDDLPQVCQFISTKEGPPATRDRLADYLTEALWKQIQASDTETLPPELQEAVKSASEWDDVSDLYSLAWRIESHDKPTDPYRTLAQLGAPLYVTAGYSDLLYEALVDAGCEPRQEICQWLERPDGPGSVFGPEKDYYPSPQEPLIFHLFGRMKYPRTLVLSEDDYFRYLMGITANKELIPEYVRKRLVESRLLFLGFRMESWDFRVLFNSLKQFGGFGQMDRKHIAAQVNLDEGKFLEPQGARDYFRRYFDERRISIYWGQVEEFVSDLHAEAPQLFQKQL